jgi:hypothetical protein
MNVPARCRLVEVIMNRHRLALIALRREPSLRAVHRASLNEGRALDALRILKRIDSVEDMGPVRDLLVLIRDRIDELLATT